MGYSTSPRAVRKVKNYLDEMAAGSAKITWVSDNPSELSYQLLNAFHAAKYLASNGEPFATYAKLKAKYIIRIGNGVVIADPREDAPLEAVRAGMDRVVIPDISDVLEVVGAAIKHNAPIMFFPDATEDICPQLYAWASKHEYFIIPSDDGITLTHTDPGDFLAWTPDET